MRVASEHERYEKVMRRVERNRAHFLEELAGVWGDGVAYVVGYIGREAAWCGRSFDETLWHFLAFNRADLPTRSEFVEHPRRIYR